MVRALANTFFSRAEFRLDAATVLLRKDAEEGEPPSSLRSNIAFDEG